MRRWNLLAYLIGILFCTIWIWGITDLTTRAETVTITEWISTTPLPQAIDNHAMVYYNNSLIVAGGRKGGESSNEVYSAALQTDGSLGNWQSRRSLITPVQSHGFFSFGPYLYVVGGWNSVARTRHSEIWRAEIATNGEIGEWHNVSNYPRKIILHDVTTVGNTVYVVGGTAADEGNTSLKEVYYATIGADGNLSAWKRTADLPEPRYWLSIASANNYLYAPGGYDGMSAQSTVFYAKVKAEDGSLEEWKRAANPLPVPLYNPEVVAHDGKLVIMGGGLPGNVQFDTIYSAPINTDGSLGNWQLEQARLPKRIYRFAAVTIPRYSSNFVYIVGGNQGGTPLDEVYHSNVPTPEPTPTPTPGVDYIRLSSEPSAELQSGQQLLYRIDYKNGTFPLSNVVITNTVPDGVVLVPDSEQPLPDNIEKFAQDGAVLTWKVKGDLAVNQSGTLSYQVAFPTPTGLTITKSAPTTVEPNGLIEYDIIVQNNTPNIVTNLIITDQVPSNTQYVIAVNGSYNAPTASWSVDELNKNDSLTVTLIVRAGNDTVTNNRYAVKTAEDLFAEGREVITYIAGSSTIPPVVTRGNLLRNEGAVISWIYNGIPGNKRSNSVLNPATLYMPVMAK